MSVAVWVSAAMATSRSMCDGRPDLGAPWPVMRRFINRHTGVPVRDAEVVTADVAQSLRNYFLGVTIIAAFNAVVIGVAALIIGVVCASQAPDRDQCWSDTSASASSNVAR
jgi:hypothetical protein